MSPPIDLVEWGPQTPNCWKLCVRAHTWLTHNHHKIPIKTCQCCGNVTSGHTLHELQGVTRNGLCKFHASLPPKVICSTKHHRATAMPRMNSTLQGTCVCTGTLCDGLWGKFGFSTRFDFFRCACPWHSSDVMVCFPTGLSERPIQANAVKWHIKDAKRHSKEGTQHIRKLLSWLAFQSAASSVDFCENTPLESGPSRKDYSEVHENLRARALFLISPF